MATHKVFKDLYGLIDAHSSGGHVPGASAVLTFGHSGGLMPLINAFEIYRDEGNLTVRKFQYPQIRWTMILFTIQGF